MSNEISPETAYKAMFEFIRRYALRTSSSDFAALLSDLSLLTDGSSADPASWEDWLTSIETVVDAEGGTGLYRPIWLDLA